MSLLYESQDDLDEAIRLARSALDVYAVIEDPYMAMVEEQLSEWMGELCCSTTTDTKLWQFGLVL